MFKKEVLKPSLVREALDELKQINPSLVIDTKDEGQMKTLCFEFLEVTKAKTYMLSLIKNPTADMCKTAVKAHGANLEFVPKKLLNRHLCEIAIKTYGMALKFTPKEFITLEMCKDAVNDYGSSLEFVPEEFRTEEICILAVQRTGIIISVLDKPSYKVRLEAVRQSGFALSKINNQSVEICYEALLSLIRDINVNVEDLKSLMSNMIKDKKISHIFEKILNGYGKDIPSLGVIISNIES